MARSPLVAFLVAGVVAAACAGQPPNGPPGDGVVDATDLAGRTFLSVAVTERGAPRPLVAATEVRLEFRGDGTWGASAGCNSMGGAYELDRARLRFESGGMTAMGCDPALHDQDEWLADFLAGGPAVAVAGDQIALSNGGVVVQLVDEEVVNPDRPLVGTRWVVEGIRSRNGASTVPFGALATLRIADDGATIVETGCNTGRTTATVEADQLRFEELALTRRACADDDVAALESAVLAVVGAESVTWSTDVDRLTLDAGGVGLDLRAG
jgi:heat shock protein HslJ